jgi:hypothetical protein
MENQFIPQGGRHKALIAQAHWFSLGTFAKLRKETISLVISICPSVLLSSRKTSATPGRIFMKFYVLAVFENLSKNASFIKI